MPHVGDGWWSFAGLWVSTLAHCDGIAERDAGLSVLGSALLMVPEVVVYLSVGSLDQTKNKADTILPLRRQYRTGSERRGDAFPQRASPCHLRSLPST